MVWSKNPKTKILLLTTLVQTNFGAHTYMTRGGCVCLSIVCDFSFCLQAVTPCRSHCGSDTNKSVKSSLLYLCLIFCCRMLTNKASFCGSMFVNRPFAAKSNKCRCKSNVTNASRTYQQRVTHQINVLNSATNISIEKLTFFLKLLPDFTSFLLLLFLPRFSATRHFYIRLAFWLIYCLRMHRDLRKS